MLLIFLSFLVVLLIIAVPVVALIVFVARKRRGTMWGLARVINGEITTNGITGLYAGRPVRGHSWTQHRQNNFGGTGHEAFFWTTSMQAPAPGADFRVRLQGPQNLTVECGDPYRASRLQEMGLPGAAAQVPDLAAGRVEFGSSGGWLTLTRSFHTNLSLPDPKTFQNDLEALRYLAQFCQ